MRPLSVRALDPARIVRISRVPAGREPFFGRTGTNRFDDPEPHEDVLYGALGLTAFAETVLHRG
jgi:hypothetical protein